MVSPLLKDFILTLKTSENHFAQHNKKVAFIRTVISPFQDFIPNLLKTVDVKYLTPPPPPLLPILSPILMLEGKSSGSKQSKTYDYHCSLIIHRVGNECTFALYQIIAIKKRMKMLVFCFATTLKRHFCYLKAF